MNLQTFKAPTMAQALAQVKSVMGRDAVILHTRTYQRRIWLGLRKQETVEITAGQGLNMLAQQRRRESAQASTGVVVRQTGAAPPSTQLVVAPAAYNVTQNRQQLMNTPEAGRVLMSDLTDQVKGLKTLIKDLATEVHKQVKPNVPEELFDFYTQLVSKRVGDDIAVELIAALAKQLRPEHYQQPEYMRLRLLELIERMIPTAGPIARTKFDGPHVIALIGPTGVGKTTTIAKLAANMQLREKKRVGLITMDTYRIAAIDQLKKYADIIGSTLRVVATPEDLRTAVDSMSGCDYVLIDTAGRSPNDRMKIHELRSVLAAATPDEVHLVLAATASQECVELAIDRFGEVRIDRMIFTKLDESPSAGVMLNICRKTNKPLSYYTTGQNVPDDIEVTRPDRLAQLIIGSNA